MVSICLNLYFTCVIGLGQEFDHDQLKHDELKELVSNKTIVLLRGKYYTNTKYLGEVLMETMLQEVSDFCKIDYQQNWTAQAHQQVNVIKCQKLGLLFAYIIIM